MTFLSNTFDMSSALSGIYLWLLFGYLSVYVNCDLQRFLRSNNVVSHLVGIVAFFFLFTVVDNDNKASLAMTWLKTVLVYLLFILTTKSKWYFAAITLVLLLGDLSYQKHVEHKKSTNSGKGNENAIALEEENNKRISLMFNVLVVISIVVGTVHYCFVQREQHKNRFSYLQFFLNRGSCKNKPN